MVRISIEIEEKEGEEPRRLERIGVPESGLRFGRTAQQPAAATATATTGREDFVGICNTLCSASHFKLVVVAVPAEEEDARELRVVDLGSKNGTRVAGVVVEKHGECRWCVGECVELGKVGGAKITLVEVLEEEDTTAAAAVAALSSPTPPIIHERVEESTKTELAVVVVVAVAEEEEEVYFELPPSPPQQVPDDGACPVCWMDMGRLTILQKQVHVNTCMEGSAKNDAAIAHALHSNAAAAAATTTSSSSTMADSVCVKCSMWLGHLTEIQALDHVNRCLDGADAAGLPASSTSPFDVMGDDYWDKSGKTRRARNSLGAAASASKSSSNQKKRQLQPSSSSATSKRKTAKQGSSSGSLPVYFYTKRASAVTEMIGAEPGESNEDDDDDDDEEAFESDCLVEAELAVELLSKRAAAAAAHDAAKTRSSDEDVFDAHSQPPPSLQLANRRTFLGAQLSDKEVRRRRSYFAKQVRHCDALLRARAVPELVAGSDATVTAALSTTSPPTLPVAWDAPTQADAVLAAIQEACQQSETADANRIAALSRPSPPASLPQ